MKLLLDTQITIWSVFRIERLSQAIRELLDDPANELLFSAVCIWEVSIKYALGKPSFDVEPRVLRGALLDRGDTERAISSEHAITLSNLPLVHKDPFDRLLVAQALTEGTLLVTADNMLAGYGSSVYVMR